MSTAINYYPHLNLNLFSYRMQLTFLVVPLKREQRPPLDSTARQPNVKRNMIPGYELNKE